MNVLAVWNITTTSAIQKNTDWMFYQYVLIIIGFLIIAMHYTEESNILLYGIVISY